jgi:cell division protein FtsB
MTDEIEVLKARRAELEREIELLESTRVAVYMPGVTIVPPEGLPEEDADQQLARLRSTSLRDSIRRRPLADASH